MQFYVIHGDADDTVNVSKARQSREKLEAGEYRFVYREITGEGHGVIGSSKSLSARKDAMSWCHSIRNRQVPLSENDEAFAKGVFLKLKAKKSVSPRVFDSLSRIGGPQVGKIIALACRAKSASLRAAAALAARKTLFGARVMKSLTGLLEDSNSKVRNAAFGALGTAAQWQYPEAQQALARYARNPDKKVTERLLAVVQLGRLIPMQLDCAHKNRGVFDALIDLLMDPDAKIRSMAFRSLRGQGGLNSGRARGRSTGGHNDPGGFGYSPRASKASRMQAVERWRE